MQCIKNILVNKNHEFYIDYPVKAWSDLFVGFELNVVNSNVFDFTSNNNKVKIKNMTNDANWAGPIDINSSPACSIKLIKNYKIHLIGTEYDTTEYSIKLNSTKYIIHSI